MMKVTFYRLKIRAASLSGDCFFWKENLARFNFGLKQHHQVPALYE